MNETVGLIGMKSMCMIQTILSELMNDRRWGRSVSLLYSNLCDWATERQFGCHHCCLLHFSQNMKNFENIRMVLQADWHHFLQYLIWNSKCMHTHKICFMVTIRSVSIGQHLHCVCCVCACCGMRTYAWSFLSSLFCFSSSFSTS